MNNKQLFRGSGVAMVTPFSQNGNIDYHRLTEHTERLIQNGMNYLVVLGTTAETPTLTDQEMTGIIRCVADACSGRVPVLCGAGGNDTRKVIDKIKKLGKEQIDGILSVAPYYNKPSQEGMYQHFAAIAAVSDLPVVLYNVPGRTASNISAETTLRLAHDFQGSIVATKEASGDLLQIMEIIDNRPDGFLVLSGDDAFTFPLITAGGEGVISVIGNAYPAQLSTMVDALLTGDMVKSRELFYRLLPMVKAIFHEGNPAGVKAVMKIRGWIENVLRLPLIPVSHSLYQELIRLDRELH